MTGASLYERLGGTYGIAGAVDVLVDRLFEIAATLKYLGVPAAEHDEFMAVIEHYRPEVTAQTPVEQEGTLEPALAQA